MPVLKVRGRDDGDTRAVPFAAGQSVRDILDVTGSRVRSGCNGTGACGLCRIRVTAGSAGTPTAREEYFIDEALRAAGVRLACQLVPAGDLEIEILNPAQKSAWRSIPPEESCCLREPATAPGTRSEPGGGASGGVQEFGIAVDIGTTQISLSLLSLGTGRRLAGRCGRNPQGETGADVMTRLVAASGSPARAREMSGLVVKAIGEGIHDIASREGLDLNRVSRVALVGNTAMLALLSERNYALLTRPESWAGKIDCVPDDACTCGWKAAWDIPPAASVSVLPPAGGFVGSDLLAGVLATGLAESTRPGLLIDFGTNSEIALWDGGRLLATSAAGGPAFEGCGIRCGLPAEPGAICRAWLSGENLGYETIAGERARGICGTGLVDSIACLVRSGILTGKGQFASPYAGNRFIVAAGNPSLVLEKRDIDLFQRAKAAVGAGICVLMAEAGIGFSGLGQVFVGGAFGKSLDVGNACAIGLLPPVPPEKIELCGNTALAGCEFFLRSPRGDTELREIRKEARVINLARDPGFGEYFLENLFLRPMEAP